MRESQWVAPQWSARLSAAGPDGLVALLERPPAQVVPGSQCRELTKPGLGGRQRWRCELPDAVGPCRTIYVKRYERSRFSEQWDRMLRQSWRHSRAWWESEQCRRLTEAHIPTPALVGIAERMRGPLEQRSVVLLESAPGDAFDRAWVAACRADAPITRGLARHDLTVRLARFVSAFHQTGCCHRDLYLCHVFVDLDADGLRPPTFTLIDLARSLRPRWRRMRWLVKDLAQLDSSARQIGASRTDRLRFLTAYLALPHRSPRVRWYCRRILRKSNGILRRIARQSRPP